MLTVALLPKLLLLCLVCEVIDLLAWPRPAGRMRPRSLAALPFRLLPALALFGGLLALVGHPAGASAILAVLLAATAIGSNVKRRVLGEPLVFTDFAVIGEMLRHPGFYLGAIPVPARLGLAAVLAAMAGLLALGWTAALPLRIAGLAMAVACALPLPLLARSGPWRRLAAYPALEADVAAHGLLACLVLYWLRWRREPDAPSPPAPAVAGGDGLPELVLVVQCESFADPLGLGDAVAAMAPPLPGLARARGQAERHGTLGVDGFGAYTMRTEFGVLFGREQQALGFRRYDPFLTAARDRLHGLPLRLGPRFGSAVFVHPHDLGFYGRDRLMPAIGFTRLVGETAFPADARHGPHVSDSALAERLATLVAEAAGPTLIYAVTIENHGPWRAGRLGETDALGAWLAHLRSGDMLLSRLIGVLEADGRPALLAFFGDHLPSIPGRIAPRAERDTPFVLLRFGPGSGRTSPVAAERLTPAGLNAAILEAASRPGG